MALAFRSRFSKLALLVAGLFTILLVQRFGAGRPNVYSGGLPQTKITDHEFVTFGGSLFEALNGNLPGIPPIQRAGKADALVFWRATKVTPRPDLVILASEDVATMRTAHAAYLDRAQDLSLPFDTNSSGIVSTAGGAYMPVFVISLRMLRRTGCQLPVELFLASKEEYEEYLCDKVLPSLNARCILLEDRLGTQAQKLESYQLKVFSILASSFQNVLFLDADNFMVQDPLHVFTEEPFSTSGLVTWPDFWASSASQHLYGIMGKPVPPMNALASSESGQLLVSKVSHGRTLLMAAYYNFYGPKHFYPLLGQGGPGEGDKDTFVAGAQAVTAPFYQVKKCVDTIGYYEDERYHGGAMLQYDPTDDTSSTDEAAKTPIPFSVHHNIPKYDPVQLFALGVTINAATGEPHRLIGTKELTLERFGRDVEYELWAEIEYVTCEIGQKFSNWELVPTKGERKGTCDTVKWYRENVFRNSPTASR